ncbi:Heavy metal transport/detoxification protein [Desulfosarcina cetonica]|uniref:heavy-metal-associated domain-containing protein n=1 Tax=Desulfosarcina cetonica TaxID=90730 RepID=UPI0006D12233|nr:heavy-metal-associated domain-containing protein [Desulfosarcina cetonica]VTR64903.1 Heavy metal transport/detoxification protein [Desulfosarcina cetonica]
MSQIILNVPNISCGHCVSSIESELSEVDGVTSVKGDAESKTVMVQWEAPASIESIRATLQEINYPAEP